MIKQEQEDYSRDGFSGPHSINYDGDWNEVAQEIRCALKRRSKIYDEWEPGTDPAPFSAAHYARILDRHLESRILWDLAHCVGRVEF